MKKLFSLLPIVLIGGIVAGQTIIGRTSYDVQTNDGAKHRVKVYDDGSVSGIWTGSTDFSGALTFADRGMFYNHKAAAGAWGAYPTTRIEATKTGFGEIIKVMDHEVIMAHDGAVTAIQLYANTAIGGTTWTELAGSDDITGFWPSAFCPEGTDDIYVVNADANPPTQLRFSRSNDGGATWSVLNSTVPFLTAADGFPGMGTGLIAAAETYQIAVHGSDVYILFGMPNSDLVLLHSASNGDPGSWSSSPIIDFPINAYDGLTQTDINGDFVTDTIETADGYHDMIIEDDGTVHVFSGYVKIYNDGLGAFWTYNYNHAMGMWYWESGMDAAIKVDLTVDWNNADGLNNPTAGIGAFRSHYRYPGLTSMPAAAYDPASGRIYLTYTMPIEYTDLFGDPTNLSAQSFRDVFGVYSDDAFATVSTPVNLTNTAETGKENVYLFVNDKVSGGKVHAVWQRDMYPGTSITDLDPVDTNYIMYNDWSTADFETTPTCDATVGPTGLYADGITSDAAVLHWNAVPLASQYTVAFFKADDLGTVGKRRPHENMYAIPAGKLLPETTYGFRVKTTCYETGEMSPYSPISYFTTLPLREGASIAAVNLFPNPNSGNFQLQLSGMDHKDVNIYITNMMGSVVYQQTMTVDASNATQSITLDNIAAGLYNVIVVSASVTTSTSVVIQ